jgi:hypothetical protein
LQGQEYLWEKKVVKPLLQLFMIVSHPWQDLKNRQSRLLPWSRASKHGRKEEKEQTEGQEETQLFERKREVTLEASLTDGWSQYGVMDANRR